MHPWYVRSILEPSVSPPGPWSGLVPVYGLRLVGWSVGVAKKFERDQGVGYVARSVLGWVRSVYRAWDMGGWWMDGDASIHCLFDCAASMPTTMR